MFLNEETDRVPAIVTTKEGLADKMSGLLRQAVEDAQILAETPGYKLDMGAWHSPNADGTCHVCMAGAAFSRRLKFPSTQSIIPHLPWMKEGEILVRKLNAINNMRTGDFVNAYKYLTGTLGCVPTTSYPPVFDDARRVVKGAYRGDCRADWDAYLRAADILEAAGY